MNTATNEYRTVEDLMRERRTSVNRMVGMTHIERRVVDAIAHQRYTPSPDDRERVSRALDLPAALLLPDLAGDVSGPTLDAKHG